MRPHQRDVRPKVDAKLVEVGARAWMHGKDQGQVRGDLDQRARHLAHVFCAVDIARTMQGHHAIAGSRAAVRRLEARRFKLLRRLPAKFLGLVKHVLDHDVAHVVHGGFRLAFTPQMLDGARFGDEEPVRDTVRHETVDLFRHAHVAAAQASLHVCHGNAEFFRRNRAGQRGIDVAYHQHGGGPLGLAQLLEGQHDLARLFRVRAAACRHEDVRLGDTQLFKKHVVHLAVVVLARMDDLERQARMALQRAHDGRDLHEIGPCAGHQVNRLHDASSCSAGQ
ncbi:hypothetical protein D3C81_1470850 [compost metagenome]